MSGEIRGETRSYGRSVGLLTVALGTAGLLAYAFFAIASHTLDRDDYGQIVVLWSAVFLIISTLFRPIEQLLSRTVAELDEQGRSVRHALRVAASIQLAVAAAFTVISLALFSPLENDLFGGDALFVWVMIGAVLAFGGSYFARGFLAGRRQMGLYGAVLLVDGMARLSFALALAFGIADGVGVVAVGIAVAPLLSLVVVPFALRAKAPPRDPSFDPADKVAVEAAPEFTLAQGGGFAAAVLVIMLSEQVFLNGGPLFVRAAEGTAAAGFIFNVLMVARAPVVLFQAVAASLLPHLTRLRSRGDETSAEAFRVSVRMTLLVIAGFSVAVVLGLIAVGPQVMELAFGEKFEYDRLGLVLVGLGMGFYLTAATLNQAALAEGQARAAAGCWLVCAVGFIVINLVPGLDVFRRVEVGFLAAAAVLSILLYALHRHPISRPEDVPEPDSPLELELRAAAADEVA